MKTLRIAAGLSLALEAVTQAIGILAKRRAGKSYAMRRLTERSFANLTLLSYREIAPGTDIIAEGAVDVELATKRSA